MMMQIKEVGLPLNRVKLIKEIKLEHVNPL
jgi:hypothetical protein